MSDRQVLAEEVARLSEQLAEYREAVADAVELFGHAGDSPDDLRDAVGQLERLLAGEDVERDDLTGLAEQVRRALWDRLRALALRDDARAVCERRTQERDEALLAARRAHG